MVERKGGGGGGGVRVFGFWWIGGNGVGRRHVGV